ncbi:MAG: hypothetical protein MUC71_10235 [Steroidobacteraceae bacterium]|nr:hypothetical protein [Steroidobacteraceae bacterium]
MAHDAERTASRGGFAALLFALACAAQASDIVLEIDPASIVTPDLEAPAPLVEVNDIRETVALERTTIGEVSLGAIEVVPPLPQLVGTIVSARAAGMPFQSGAGEDPPVIYCDLRRFSIETPATLLYWDIKSRIDVVLRVGDRDREVSASAKARTWVYPSKTLLEQVTREALLDLSEKVEPALAELLSAPPVEDEEAAAEAGTETEPQP